MILLILVGLGLAYCGAANHFVMTERGMKIYKKEYLSFNDTYVDMRQVGVSNLSNYKPVVKAMVSNGDMALVPGGNTLQRLMNAGASFSRSLRQIDCDYGISDSAHEIGRVSKEKYRQLDDRYGIEDKAAAANRKVKEGAGKFKDWLEKQ